MMKMFSLETLESSVLNPAGSGVTSGSISLDFTPPNPTDFLNIAHSLVFGQNTGDADVDLTNILVQEKLIGEEILEKIKNQINQN